MLDEGRDDRIVLSYDRVIEGGQPDLFVARDAMGEVSVQAVESVESELYLSMTRPIEGQAVLHYGYTKAPSRVAFVRDETGPAPVFRNVVVIARESAQ